MGYDLTTIFIFVLFGVAFVVFAVAVMSRMLRPRVVTPREPAKAETYECGEPAIGSSRVRFDIRFYTVALVFIIFDVEVAFLFPWSVIYEDLRKAGLGTTVFLEVLLFIGILVVGLVYCWRKGDLDWVKSSEPARESDAGAALPQHPPAPDEEEEEPGAPAPQRAAVEGR
jgi:NADH-quinone oxidoreductase subunit A